MDHNGSIRAGAAQAKGLMVGKEGEEAASEDLLYGCFIPKSSAHKLKQKLSEGPEQEGGLLGTCHLALYFSSLPVASCIMPVLTMYQVKGSGKYAKLQGEFLRDAGIVPPPMELTCQTAVGKRFPSCCADCERRVF